jgi:hypothetical protein
MEAVYMSLIENLLERRQKVLNQIGDIQYMQRGTINEQYLKVPQKGAVPAIRGPYYVLSWNDDGKTRSERIKSGELEQIRQDIKNYKYFQTLTKEFIEITETITKEIRAEQIDLKKTNLQ